MAWGNALWMWELSCKATAQTSRLSVGSTWEKLLGGSSQSSKCESFYTRTMLLAEVQWTSVSGAKATGGGGPWSWLKWGGGASTGTSSMPAQWCEQPDWLNLWTSFVEVQCEKERNSNPGQSILIPWCNSSSKWSMNIAIEYKAWHWNCRISKVISLVFSAYIPTLAEFEHWTVYEAHQ